MRYTEELVKEILCIVVTNRQVNHRLDLYSLYFYTLSIVSNFKKYTSKGISLINCLKDLLSF